MKNRSSVENEGNNPEKFKASKSINMKKKKQNMMRLGGKGLSLETFANAKSNSSHYNPSIIKKQREFYKNAKYVSKFKKQVKQQGQQNYQSSTPKPMEAGNETEEGSKMVKRSKNHGSRSLNELYERQRQEKEKARMEREAIIKAKKEEREKAEALRKDAREKMLKRTQHGQPIMKYRIEHLLQSIQGLNSNS